MGLELKNENDESGLFACSYAVFPFRVNCDGQNILTKSVSGKWPIVLCSVSV